MCVYRGGKGCTALTDWGINIQQVCSHIGTDRWVQHVDKLAPSLFLWTLSLAVGVWRCTCSSTWWIHPTSNHRNDQNTWQRSLFDRIHKQRSFNAPLEEGLLWVLFNISSVTQTLSVCMYIGVHTCPCVYGAFCIYMSIYQIQMQAMKTGFPPEYIKTI